MDTLTAEAYPEFFQNSSYPQLMAQLSGDGSTNIFTLKDRENFEIVDNVASMSSQYLSFQVKTCDNQTSSVTCADFGEDMALLKQYLSAY